MKSLNERYTYVGDKIDEILGRAEEFESFYAELIVQVHPMMKASAINMVHYLAFRSFDVDQLQSELEDLGLPLLNNIEGHVMHSLLSVRRIVCCLCGEPVKPWTFSGMTRKKSHRVLRKNNKALFGWKSKKRNTRIMVTLPTRAAEDQKYVERLISLGMNCARINCAYGDTLEWMAMIDNICEAGQKLNNHCTITMDLAGPKLRTGPMTPGPEVIHFKPRRDDFGNVAEAARIWLAAPDVVPPRGEIWDATLPVDPLFASKLRPGSQVYFIDTRGKKIKIIVDRVLEEGSFGLCKDSAYVASGTQLILHKVKPSGAEVHKVGKLLAKENYLVLKTGDWLRLDRDPVPGEQALLDDDGNVSTPSHISCSLPEVFEDVREGEPIHFNDGKIEGQIEKVCSDHLLVKITSAKPKGSKLRSDKGINLPATDIKIGGLMEKDLQDLPFVAKYADTINFSFVNKAEDVIDLYKALDHLESDAGVILKIETMRGFRNLPHILLHAMRRFPVGVMIARGDLAIETGWKDFATIQQEIRRICATAHIPDVLATQVLDNLAKKGIPTRSEITDAALADRSECVMLNKGPFIHRALKLLDRILRRSQKFHNKTTSLLPKISVSEDLRISHGVLESYAGHMDNPA